MSSYEDFDTIYKRLAPAAEGIVVNSTVLLKKTTKPHSNMLIRFAKNSMKSIRNFPGLFM